MICGVLAAYLLINLRRLISLRLPVLPPRSAFADAIDEADYDSKPVEPLPPLPEKYRARPGDGASKPQ